MRRLAFALLAAASACARAAPVDPDVRAPGLKIELEPGWRFREGDDPAWASPDLDDSAWESARPFEGWAWFRRRLELSKVPDGRGAIELDGAAESFVNGMRVREDGAIPGGALRPGVNIVAAKARRPVGRGAIYFGPEAEFILDVESSPTSGTPCANFSMSAEIAASGRILPRIYHESRLLGRGQFSLEEGGRRFNDHDFDRKEVRRGWPWASVGLEHAQAPDLRLEVRATAPVGLGDASLSSTPILLIEAAVKNRRPQPRVVALRYKWRSEQPAALKPASISGFEGFTDGTLFLGFEGPTFRFEGRIAHLARRLDVPPGGEATVRFVVTMGATDSIARWKELWSATEEFERHLPRTGDSVLDGALRWYLVPAVVPKLPGSQREGYWAGWAHLAYWPELERRAIEAAAAAQKIGGKIPTSLHPETDLKEDLDSNAYFVIRAWRYFEWRRERPFLESMWPAIKQAVDYLRDQDRTGDGVPDHLSPQADWNPQPGFKGRQYSPHVSLLWLAALAAGKSAAETLGHTAAAKAWGDLYAAASARVNAPAEEGGQWNGRCYVNVWYDRRTDPTMCEEQAVGPLFGVVPADRAARIFEALGDAETDRGVRESFPPRGEGFGPGGIHPMFNAIDGFARLACGRSEEGVRLLKKIARSDLSDYAPHEWIEPDTGRNFGGSPGVWGPAYFAATSFGCFGVRRLSDDALEIRPRLALDRVQQWRIPMAEGAIEVNRSPGGSSVTSALNREIELRYGDSTRALKPGETLKFE
jgi:hypothetical protein